MNVTFNTNSFFSGGGGMLVQYHDIIKPVYLLAIIKLILNGNAYGLPIQILDGMSILSLIEWYMKRRDHNPLVSLDFNHIIEKEELDNLLKVVLKDEGLYKLSPTLNVYKQLNAMQEQSINIPVYIYNDYEDENIIQDCKSLFPRLNLGFKFGNIVDVVKSCEQNFTYILSQIEKVVDIIKCNEDKFSHILIPQEYRYNYIDNYRELKYEVKSLLKDNHYIRLGFNNAVDYDELAMSLNEFI